MCQKHGDIVGINWLDACAMHDRIQESDIKTYVGLSKNFNIGWVLDQNKTRLLLCNGKCSTGELDVMTIPVGNIIKKVKLCK